MFLFFFFFLISPFGIWGKKNVSSRSILCMDIYLPCTGLGWKSFGAIERANSTNSFLTRRVTQQRDASPTSKEWKRWKKKNRYKAQYVANEANCYIIQRNSSSFLNGTKQKQSPSSENNPWHSTFPNKILFFSNVSPAAGQIQQESCYKNCCLIFLLCCATTSACRGTRVISLRKRQSAL